MAAVFIPLVSVSMICVEHYYMSAIASPKAILGRRVYVLSGQGGIDDWCKNGSVSHEMKFGKCNPYAL